MSNSLRRKGAERSLDILNDGKTCQSWFMNSYRMPNGATILKRMKRSKKCVKSGFGVPPNRVGRSRPIGPATMLRIEVKKYLSGVARCHRAGSPDRASHRKTTRATSPDRARNEYWGSKIPPDRAGSPNPADRVTRKRVF
uniref:Uncharacterized protein n=1 Tax=Beta vulgaris subsp. vulgaris TaxID=3555 RepID=J3S670_BETVV|nr:hypothetical protein [Beta vulgaris subsp. vulgaris]